MSAEVPSLPDPDALFDETPCGLIVSSEDGTVLRVNQTFCNWLGRNQNEVRGGRFQSLLTMGGRIFHQTHWMPLMQMQGSVAEVKLDLMHRDGRTVTMLLNGVRREHNGTVFHELALFATADRDRYERELLKAREHAEELLREKTQAEQALQRAQAELSIAYEKSQRRALFAEQMVAIASHDLKNPLTAIKMASDFLSREERRTKEVQLLQHISQSSERAQRMIADLLDFALARVGRGIGITRSEQDLHHLVGKSVAELRVAFPGATMKHTTYGTGMAYLDADRLQQIIGNLVANSVAYGDCQYPISICSRLEQGGATVSVHNHGAVIPDALRSTLFEPMTRGSDRDDDVRSVGLGLFIVREIANAHGGEVGVTSNTETGTTFSVMFPNTPPG